VCQCAVDAKCGGKLLDARHVPAVVSELISGQVDARQRACDGYHSSNCVCSHWTDAVLLDVERRELGLLVSLDGLADCAYALILEVIEGEIQGRQRVVDANQRGDHDGGGNAEALV
jgi:hypothetical protein